MASNAQIAGALLSLAPDAQWSLNGETLAGLKWSDGAIERPNDAAILAEVERLAAALPPPPAQISDRQFFQQLAVAGAITEAEALAAVKTGDIPANLQAVVDALPPAAKFNAEMLLSGATVFARAHPMTEALGAAMKWNAGQIDDLWRAAAAL